MAAIAGRDIVITRNGVAVAGCRAKSIAINGTPINVTNDDDDGVQKLLDVPGELAVSISVSGILLNEALCNEAMSTSDRTQTTVFTIGTGSPTWAFSGSFFMSSFQIDGPYQEGATFSAEFQSAGAVTLTS